MSEIVACWWYQILFFQWSDPTFAHWEWVCLDVCLDVQCAMCNNVQWRDTGWRLPAAGAAALQLCQSKLKQIWQHWQRLPPVFPFVLLSILWQLRNITHSLAALTLTYVWSKENIIFKLSAWTWPFQKCQREGKKKCLSEKIIFKKNEQGLYKMKPGRTRDCKGAGSGVGHQMVLLLYFCP